MTPPDSPLPQPEAPPLPALSTMWAMQPRFERDLGAFFAARRFGTGEGVAAPGLEILDVRGQWFGSGLQICHVIHFNFVT